MRKLIMMAVTTIMVMVRMMRVSMKMMVGEKFSFVEEETMMIVWVMIIIMFQGGRCWGSPGAALHERSGSSMKGRTPTYAILSRNFKNCRDLCAF